jgi:hypothetical protein
MKITKSKLKEIIREEVQKLDERRDVNKELRSALKKLGAGPRGFTSSDDNPKEYDFKIGNNATLTAVSMGVLKDMVNVLKKHMYNFNVKKNKKEIIFVEELLNEKSWEDDERTAKQVSGKIDKGVKAIIYQLQTKVIKLYKGNYAADKDSLLKDLKQVKDNLDDVLHLVQMGR